MPKTNRPSTPRYDAFISYSHGADVDCSAALQRGLQKFAKVWYRRRALHIFRDATALTPEAPLPAVIESAIAQSRYLILLASPKAAASPWVQREVETWLQEHGVDRLLLVLTGGTLNWSEATGDFDRDNSTALPPQLFGAFAAEPLFIDLCNAADTATSVENDPRFRDAIATLSAAIQQRPKDDLVGEDLVQHRRTLRIAWGAAGLLAALAIATSIVSIWAVQQRDIAEARELQARAGQLAADASRLLSEQPDQTELATLLAIQSVGFAPSGNGQRALVAAAKLLPGRVAESFGEQVEKLAFSTDKRWLARGDAQMGVMLWNLETGEIPQLSTSGEVYNQLQVRDLQFSPDSQRLAIASGGYEARVYDLTGADTEWVFDHDDTVMTVAFDPAGERLASGAKDGHLRVWEVATQSLLLDDPMSVEDVRVVKFNHDGSLLGAVASNGPIRLYRTADWREVEIERVTPAEGLDLDFSPDGTLFAVTRANRAVIWSLPDGQVVTSVEHSDYAGAANMVFDTHLWELTFSPDSSLLVTAGRDRTVRFWRPHSGEEVLRLSHRTSIENVAFTADGTRIATASYGLAQLWRLPEGEEILRVAPTDGGNAMALTNDGTLIATGGPESSVRVMSTASAVDDGQYSHIDDVVGLACHPDKPLVATVDDKHNVQVWDTTTDEMLRSTNVFGPRRLKFSKTGELFVGSSNALSRLELSGEVQVLVPRRTESVALHDDYAAARVTGGAILAWPTHGNSDPIRIDADAHSDIYFNENGRLLVSERWVSNGVGTAHIWDVQTGEQVWQVGLEYVFGNKLALDHLGKTLAVASVKTITLHSREEDRPRKIEFDEEIRWMMFFAQGTRLAVLLDRELVVLDTFTWQPAATAMRHDSRIRFLSLNADRTLAATTLGGNVAVWDLETGERLANWSTEAHVSRLCFLAGDDAVVMGGNNNQATVRRWRTSDLVGEACGRLTRNLTAQEWETYLPGLAYQSTCPDLEPLSREQLLEAMNPRSPFDP